MLTSLITLVPCVWTHIIHTNGLIVSAWKRLLHLNHGSRLIVYHVLYLACTVRWKTGASSGSVCPFSFTLTDGSLLSLQIPVLRIRSDSLHVASCALIHGGRTLRYRNRGSSGLRKSGDLNESKQWFWDLRPSLRNCANLNYENWNQETSAGSLGASVLNLRPISLLRISLLRFLDSSFPGNSLWSREYHPLILRLCLRQTLWNPES